MNSIRLRLLRWLLAPILLINLMGAATTYLLAWMPAQVAFDQSLFDAASALAARVVVARGGAVLDLPAQAEQVLRTNDVDTMYFQVRGHDGRVLAGDAVFPAAREGEAGAYDAVINGEAVRLYFRTVGRGGDAVQVGVASTTRKRSQTRAAIVRIVLVLETLFTVLLVGLIWVSVSRGLVPLERMRSGLARRDAGDLAALDERSVPTELVPVVAAFNELLGKVARGARAQQDFMADVAHQLRTPLAGTQLQLDWLSMQHAGDPETRRALSLISLNNERMTRQTNQLLSLARAEPNTVMRRRHEPVQLAELVSQAVQYFVEQAAAKHIDIGFDLQGGAVNGDAFLLRDLIDNLIDNAVRFTPEGGVVNVSCAEFDGRARLCVDDSGPGIPREHRARVFQRRVRLSADTGGSGLGLAIVRDVAQAHGASVTLKAHAGRPGLLVQVDFPPV